MGTNTSTSNDTNKIALNPASANAHYALEQRKQLLRQRVRQYRGALSVSTRRSAGIGISQAATLLARDHAQLAAFVPQGSEPPMFLQVGRHQSVLLPWMEDLSQPLWWQWSGQVVGGNGVSASIPSVDVNREIENGGGTNNCCDHLSDCHNWGTQDTPASEAAPLPLPASALQDATLVLVPALSVDYVGTRLGQGGGWYDRALQYSAPHAQIWAVVYEREFWTADLLPCLPHDRPVHGVVTPAGLQQLRDI